MAIRIPLRVTVCEHIQISVYAEERSVLLTTLADQTLTGGGERHRHWSDERSADLGEQGKGKSLGHASEVYCTFFEEICFSTRIGQHAALIKRLRHLSAIGAMVIGWSPRGGRIGGRRNHLHGPLGAHAEVARRALLELHCVQRNEALLRRGSVTVALGER